MYLLDSDSLSNLLTITRNYPQLNKRVLQTKSSLIFISIISVEENLRGLLEKIHADRNADRITERYQTLQEYLVAVSKFQILPFDQKAKSEFQSMSSKLKKHGSNDCRIAAIAISRGFIVVTCNKSDYKDIPNLSVEDWTIEESIDEHQF